MLTEQEFLHLYDYCFDPEWPGYNPKVIESPDGDGVWDDRKRYAHVSLEHIEKDAGASSAEQIKKDAAASSARLKNWYKKQAIRNHPLMSYLDKGVDKARGQALRLGVPSAFWPDKRYSTIRVLEYPPGASSAKHTDFSLFTLPMYRNISLPRPKQVYYGELLELINQYYTAQSHEVDSDREQRTQYSAVFFAIPNHAAVLPTGETVGDYIKERRARSRAYLEGGQ
jgi:hypothetical protein